MEILFLIGRILFGGVFLAFGVMHIKGKKEMIEWMKSKKVSSPNLINTLSAIILIFSGLMIILGIFTDVAAVLLILFLIGATFKMHDFWNIEDKQKKMENTIYAMYNLALIGGNLIVLYISYWPLSL